MRVSVSSPWGNSPVTERGGHRVDALDEQADADVQQLLAVKRLFVDPHIEEVTEKPVGAVLFTLIERVAEVLVDLAKYLLW